MVQRIRKGRKRFSVSLSKDEYAQLIKIADSHKPPLTLQYLVNWSIQDLLNKAKEGQLDSVLGNPLRGQRG